MQTITISRTHGNTVRINLGDFAGSMDRIVFDQHYLTIREASIDDRKTLKVSANHTINLSVLRPDELVGDYEVEREGDRLKLYRA